jgi:hypothetical protein
MSAARPLPDAALLTITIQPGGMLSSANANQKLGPLDSVAFRNTAGFPVDLVMTNTLSSISNLLQGASSGAQGGSTPLNVTLNYTILNHNTGQPTGGPYSIQFGIGPLPITITAETPSPDPIAIPIGGQVQFTSDGSYAVGWTFANGQPANVWSPQPGQINQGLNTPPQTALAGANGQTLTYTLLADMAIRGKGTVKIGT